jgi:hypothetical protein
MSDFLLPNEIYAQIFRDSAYPRAELLAVADLVYICEALQQRLLAHILGIVDIAKHAQTNRKDMP